jgi:hypothetical protein
MPANNRVSGSVALKTNDIWTKTIGHDPYKSSTESASVAAGSLDGFMKLAQIQNSTNSQRGGCGKCGALGHLTFQCRNEVGPIENSESSDFDTSDDDDSIRGPKQISAVSGKRKYDDDKVKDEEKTSKRSKKEKKEKKVHLHALLVLLQ